MPAPERVAKNEAFSLEVNEGIRYAVVEKIDEAGEVAAEQDPRS